jgi:hemerythrin-like domain-containing protein
MNAIDLLTQDHRQVKDLFKRFEDTDEEAARRGIAETLIKELSIHAAIEEAHFYPEIRDNVEGADELVNESLHEHQELKERLATVDGMLDKAGTKAFADKVAKVREAVEHHVGEEEGELFPRVRESLSKTKLEEIGRALKNAKASAPTRPHPHQPPATEITGKADAVVDIARDAIRQR